MNNNRGLINPRLLVITGPEQGGSYPIAVAEGKTYFWCVCGRSAAQPFCDGSHKDTGLSPLKFTAAKDETLYFCGCKATGNPPFCDGSHNRL